MYSRKIALAHARQIRRCPPHSLLKDPDRSAEMDLHLAVCPHCPETLHEMESMALLARKLTGGDAFADAAADLDAAVGQIRYIRSDKAGWHQGYHYNPPMVVVLEVRKKISDDILVAQIYDDIVLAAIGDLILGDDLTGAGELFVECWNTYTLKSAYLGTPVGQTAAPVIQAIRRLEADPEDTPPWAPLPFPLREDDPRLYFRELEVETAFFFSSQAAGELMAELEKGSVHLSYASPAELYKDVQRKVPGIRFPFHPVTFEEALVTPAFPQDYLPLAAADELEKSVIGKRAVFKDGIISDFEPIGVNIFKIHDMGAGRVGYSGCIPAQPEDARPVRIIFRFALPDGHLIEPFEEPRWNMETGFFSVVFDTPVKDWTKLQLAILYEVDGEK